MGSPCPGQTGRRDTAGAERRNHVYFTVQINKHNRTQTEHNRTHHQIIIKSLKLSEQIEITISPDAKVRVLVWGGVT